VQYSQSLLAKIFGDIQLDSYGETEVNAEEKKVWDGRFSLSIKLLSIGDFLWHLKFAWKLQEELF
jgi:hypothetical protein